ncbi:hypothetical protein [Pyramidobacter piscolens]|uniref:hypothetical protein n=1 Tax=Pyramidobacter piscolens TaxID=638849 RepID=UPI002AB057AB|nr:hypothetical protein [Pyramidobacter piscolens]
MTLTDLTGQSSGIVLYSKSDEVIVVNWGGKCNTGLPHLFAFDIIGLPDDDLDNADPDAYETVDDIRTALPDPDDMDVVYDHNDDISELYADNAEVTSGRVWHVGDDAVVIAPDGWH